MKRLTAKEIKKILLGVVLSDGCIDTKNQRFDFYSKKESYAKHIYEVVSQITGMVVHFKVKKDKRGYVGYRVWTNKHAYWNNLSKVTYGARKELNNYNVSRLDALSLAHIWMCDGYLAHAKNRVNNSAQNIGWFCFEAYPKEELEILKSHLLDQFGVGSVLSPVPWGRGYRIRVGGENLQKFISLIYPYILTDFLYKTVLFYKKRQTANLELPNAEHIIKEYVNVEDIVRYSKQLERT